ncbi:MAG: SDR family NAD(P)-dependent oxidoreductase [Prevotella sp.]|nr:SDR family NAD(P)-dependent oxidoreductase [Prevotella sp.]
MSNNGKVILITGASSGMGYETAKLLATNGFCVYGAARRYEEITSLSTFGVRALYLDVTDENSCRKCVDAVIQETGHIDVLINGAGYGSFGPVEAVTMEEARRQFDVNFFGLMLMTRMVLPYMRKQGKGRIINISSVGGRFTSHFGSLYHASKYAVESLSDGLRMELEGFGIEVVIIEPTGTRTAWGHIAANHLEDSGRGTVYESQTAVSAARMRKVIENHFLFTNVNTITRVICRAVKSRHPKVRYVAGVSGWFMILGRKLLPIKWFDSIAKKVI